MTEKTRLEEIKQLANAWWEEEGRPQTEKTVTATKDFYEQKAWPELHRRREQVGTWWQTRGEDLVVRAVARWEFWGMMTALAVAVVGWVMTIYSLPRTEMKAVGQILIVAGCGGGVVVFAFLLEKWFPQLRQLDNGPSFSTDGGATIDGTRLLHATLDQLRLESAGKTAGLLAGGGASLGCGLITLMFGSMGGFAAVVFLLWALANTSAGPFALIVVIIGALVVFALLNSSTNQGRSVMRDPTPVTDMYIAEQGGRMALDSEIDKLKDAALPIVDRGGQNLQLPRKWVVVNKNIASSQTLGDCIFLSRTMLHSSFLDAIVAYELARLNQGDGKIRLALQQLNIAQRDLPFVEKWVMFWRQQVYQADEFVFKVGHGDKLIRYLEVFEPFEMAKSWYDQDEPYAAERIERLNKLFASAE